MALGDDFYAGFCYNSSSLKLHADVVELVDTHALGACAARREGSSPFIRTIEIIKQPLGAVFRSLL